MIELLIQQAYEARQRAYAPYSKFHVGACVVSEDNELFTGCNVENASYGLTICAERSAIAALINAGKKHLKAMAIVGPGAKYCSPCGACRQVIREFALHPEVPVYIGNEQKAYITKSVAELLPESFGPEFL